ncbi:5'-flap endonuclease [Hypoxylon texense]
MARDHHRREQPEQVEPMEIACMAMHKIPKNILCELRHWGQTLKKWADLIECAERNPTKLTTELQGNRNLGAALRNSIKALTKAVYQQTETLIAVANDINTRAQVMAIQAEVDRLLRPKNRRPQRRQLQQPGSKSPKEKRQLQHARGQPRIAYCPRCDLPNPTATREDELCVRCKYKAMKAELDRETDANREKRMRTLKRKQSLYSSHTPPPDSKSSSESDTLLTDAPEPFPKRVKHHH